MWIILTTNTEVVVLPTILNRCIKMHFESYTKEELKSFSWMVSNPTDFMFEICKTPGQLLDASNSSMQDLERICNLLNSLPTNRASSFANLLKISNKINYKENYDKFDFDIFLNAVEYVAFKTYVNNNNKFSLKLYNIVNEYKQILVGRKLAKEHFITHMLTEIWKEVEKCRLQNSKN